MTLFCVVSDLSGYPVTEYNFWSSGKCVREVLKSKNLDFGFVLDESLDAKFHTKFESKKFWTQFLDFFLDAIFGRKFGRKFGNPKTNPKKFSITFATKNFLDAFLDAGFGRLKFFFGRSFGRRVFDPVFFGRQFG